MGWLLIAMLIAWVITFIVVLVQAIIMIAIYAVAVIMGIGLIAMVARGICLAIKWLLEKPKDMSPKDYLLLTIRSIHDEIREEVHYDKVNYSQLARGIAVYGGLLLLSLLLSLLLFLVLEGKDQFLWYLDQGGCLGVMVVWGIIAFFLHDCLQGN